jgi:hypothetical protein
LGKRAIILNCDPLQELSTSKVKKLLPTRALALTRVAFGGE